MSRHHHRCRACGTAHDLVADWPELRLRGYVGGIRAGGRLYAVELRQCPCENTLAEDVEIIDRAGRHEIVPTAIPADVVVTEEVRLTPAGLVAA